MSRAMDDQDRKYYDFIPLALEKLLKSSNDVVKFDKYYNQLYAVVPKYGFSLVDFKIILDNVINPESSLKNAQRNKLITLFYCRELLDFNCILKILSVFKTSSYYDRKSTIFVIPKNIQIKLSNFLIKNYINIKWEKKFLRILNLLFDLLSIGYLRSNIGLFLIYVINISFEIDPAYKKEFFFTAKKLETVLEFFDVDQKNSIPLLLYFSSYLHSKQRSELFDVIYSKYKLILSDLKIPKDSFGKLNVSYINQLVQMKELLDHDNSDDRIIFGQNVKVYIQMIYNMNMSSTSRLANDNTKKRKYLEDENFTNIMNNLNLHNIFTMNSLASGLDDEIRKWNSATIHLLKYMLTLNINDLIVSELSNVLTNDEVLFSCYVPIISIICSVKTTNLNDSLISIFQIQNNTMKLSNDMHWIFKGISNIYKIFPELDIIECISDILAGNINVEFYGSEEDKYNIMNTYELLQFLEPNYHKYESLLKNIVNITIKSNNKNMMKGIVLLATNWREDVESFYLLLNLILSQISYSNYGMFNEFMILIKLTHEIPYSLIDMRIFILRSDIMAMIFFSNDLININMLLEHVMFCKKYFADYGLNKIENSKYDNNYETLRSIKELHNSYIMDICNFLWRNKAYEINNISSGRFFGFPNSFVEKLEGKSMDLVHMPATRGLYNIFKSDEYYDEEDMNDDDSEKNKLEVFKILKNESYNGITWFLQNSIRGLNNIS